MNYIFHLLPEWLQRLIQPEVDDVVAAFSKAEAKLQAVRSRHVTNHSVLLAVRDDIEDEINDTVAEIERAERIAARIAKLVA